MKPAASLSVTRDRLAARSTGMLGADAFVFAHDRVPALDDGAMKEVPR